MRLQGSVVRPVRIVGQRNQKSYRAHQKHWTLVRREQNSSSESLQMPFQYGSLPVRTHEWKHHRRAKLRNFSEETIRWKFDFTQTRGRRLRGSFSSRWKVLRWRRILFSQSDVCARIKDYRPVKNRRVEILPFVTFFKVSSSRRKTFDRRFSSLRQEFSEEAETVFEKSARVADLHRVYKNLVTAIFSGIEQSAASHGERPESAELNDQTRWGEEKSSTERNSNRLFFLVENYHQMQRSSWKSRKPPEKVRFASV